MSSRFASSMWACLGTVCSVLGCGPAEPPPRAEASDVPPASRQPASQTVRTRTAPSSQADERVAPSAMRVRFEGRVDTRAPDAPRFAWPASGFRVAFQGTRLDVTLDDVVLDDDVRDPDWLAVFVDDREPVTLVLREGIADYTLARGLAAGVHHVRVLKRTESEAGTVRLLGARRFGSGAFVGPESARPRSLMAIGDSITAGCGIDGPDAHCHYGASTSNALRTYTFLAAESLHAEYQAIAWSGRGLYRNLEDERMELLPALYERTIATDPESRFDPARHPADTIVVNVGTNDLSQARPNRTRFVAAYTTLLARIRADYPDATIVLVVGPMLADDYPPGSMALSKAREWVSSVVAARVALGDTRISFLEMPGATPDEGYGCDFHPSARTHRRMATTLVEHLRTVQR